MGVNHKRVYRLYTEEGLTLKRRRPKRRRSVAPRQVRPVVSRPDQDWAMDFVHDMLSGGRSMRVLAVLDVHTRECIALQAKSVFRGEDVAQILSEAGQERKLPERIRVDNATEFTSKALDHWAFWNRVQLDFSRPGKPTDNAHIEAFNASLRRECLSQHWFVDMEEAQSVLESWRQEYNNHRPHSSLGQVPPAHYRSGGAFTPTPRRLLF
jgi:putative transposase